MKIDKIDKSELGEMTSEFYDHLTAPMDDMYDEGIIPSCDFYKMSNENGVCGFFALNKENVLLKFFLNDEERKNADSVFDELITHKEIKKALTYSNDPLFYNQCKRKASGVEKHDYLFHEAEIVVKVPPFENIKMENPKIEELEKILLYFEGIGMTGDWLRYYLTQRIETRSIFIFRFEGAIIGTGEMRPSKSSAAYANVGMTVSSEYRRRGLGCYILSTMRNQANEIGLKAICSTDVSNVASYNTILKSGFTCYHRIEEISF